MQNLKFFAAALAMAIIAAGCAHSVRVRSTSTSYSREGYGRLDSLDTRSMALQQEARRAEIRAMNVEAWGDSIFVVSMVTPGSNATTETPFRGYILNALGRTVKVRLGDKTERLCPSQDWKGIIIPANLTTTFAVDHLDGQGRRVVRTEVIDLFPDPRTRKEFWWAGGWYDWRIIIK